MVDPWDPVRLAVYRGPAGERLALVEEREERPRPVVSDDVAMARTNRRRARSRARGWNAVIRLGAFYFVAESLSFGTGVWMGRAESRLSALERGQRVRAEQRSIDATSDGGTHAERPSVEVDAGFRDIERPDTPGEFPCRAPRDPAPDGGVRNAHPRPRMKGSGTTR